MAKIARRRHPETQILLCGDNDSTTDGNPGKAKAEYAAAAVGGIMALPHDFSGDWNDFHQVYGLAKTQEAIMSACIGSNQSPDVSQMEGQGLPSGFDIRGDRLCVLELVGRGDDARQELVPISSPVRVLAETSDEHGRGYGRLLEWQDSAGRTRQWAMPVRSLVQRNGEEIFSALLDAGLPFIDLGHKRKLAAYLMACQPDKRITCVERTGWHHHAYVLPGRSIGPDAQSVILQTTGYTPSDFTERGTLTDWQQSVAELAIGNSRLCFALSLAFAAPLLSLVGMEGGDFTLRGKYGW